MSARLPVYGKVVTRFKQATRWCKRCEAEVEWIKRARVMRSGLSRNYRACTACGFPTSPIHGRRKKDTMPAGLYGYRQKVKIANELWRHLIYRKAIDGKCAVCGLAKGLQAMHIFPKGKYPHLRFDLDNGAPGCAGCHMRLTNDHEAHTRWAKTYLGEADYERLRLLSLSKAKADVDLVILYLRQKSNEPTTTRASEDAEGT